MIIKYYTKDGTLVLIEHVADICVPTRPAFGDYSLDFWRVFDFDSEKDYNGRPDRKPNDPKPHSVITYSDGNGPCALYVYNTAYICTDEGKTIEKVSSVRPVPVAV